MEEVSLLNVEQTAKLLNVSPRTVWSLVKAGRLPVVRIGTSERGRVLIPRKALERWIEKQTIGGEQN